MPGLSGQYRDTPHEGAANPEDVDVHLRFLITLINVKFYPDRCDLDSARALN
jgi:hypothetical protein